MLEKIMIILGLLCIGYFAGIAGYAGLSSKFPIIWAMVGILLLGGACFLHQKYKIPTGVKLGFTILTVAGLVLFFSVEARIVKEMYQKPKSGMDYILVLGAQVKGNRPSLSLQYRIDEAAEYLRKNKETKAILSGGKGTGEAISEAQCMRQELEAQGIASERLFEEDRSTNTKENIDFSYEILQKEMDKKETDWEIGIVTNDFHVFRGTSIAKKRMNGVISGVPARSNHFLQLNYMVREFFGVIKDKLAGNL